MSRGTDLLRESVPTFRRRAIIEGVVGLSLTCVAVLCALRGETWHATPMAFIAGGTVMAAILTYAKAKAWARVASMRGRT